MGRQLRRSGAWSARHKLATLLGLLLLAGGSAFAGVQLTRSDGAGPAGAPFAPPRAPALAGPPASAAPPAPPAPGTLPAPKITALPADLSSSASVGFSYTDAQSVSFLCRLDGGAAAACGSGKSGSISYSGLADGSHTFSVYASSGSKQSPAASYTWTIDTTPPPAPTFKKTDVKGAGAHFQYQDAEKGASFRCRLDGGDYADCGPATNYNHLADGTHTFCVEAVDKAGNASAAACYGWQTGAGLPFTISGDASDFLYPGAPASEVDLAFSNPNGVAIQVTSLTVSVASVSAPNATADKPCTVTDFAVTPFGGGYPLAIPAGKSTLDSLGVDTGSWPTVQMVDANRDQDGCVGATVTLSYSGSAHS